MPNLANLKQLRDHKEKVEAMTPQQIESLLRSITLKLSRYRCLRGKYDAGDILHDAFLRSVPRAQLIPASSLVAWLRTASYRIIQEYHRKQLRLFKSHKAEYHQNQISQQQNNESNLDPDYIALENTLRELSEVEQVILKKRCFNNKSYREIKELLADDYSESALRQHYSRALKKLRTSHGETLRATYREPQS